MSSGTTRLTESIGMAKPIPALVPDGDRIAVLTPIARPAEFEQRPARIARIDGRVGLDHVGDLAPAAGRQPAFERADDAGGQRLVEPERVADREHPLADLEVVGGSDRDRGRQRPGVVDPDHREVVVRRGPHELRSQDLARGQADREAAGAFDHVIVGDDVAGGVPDETGPGLRRAVLALQLRFERAAGARAHDLHHRRRGALEDVDARAFDVRQRTARLDRARRRGREQQPVEIGLGQIEARHEHKPKNGNPGESVTHRAPPQINVPNKPRCDGVVPGGVAAARNAVRDEGSGIRISVVVAALPSARRYLTPPRAGGRRARRLSTLAYTEGVPGSGQTYGSQAKKLLALG